MNGEIKSQKAGPECGPRIIKNTINNKKDHEEIMILH